MQDLHLHTLFSSEKSYYSQLLHLHAQNQPAKLSVAATQLSVLLMWVEVSDSSHTYISRQLLTSKLDESAC